MMMMLIVSFVNIFSKFKTRICNQLFLSVAWTVATIFVAEGIQKLAYR